METIYETRRSTGFGALGRLLSATAKIMLGDGTASRPVISMSEALKLDVVGVPGVTPASYGLEPPGLASTGWRRTDLTVYIQRYENGWGKAESEDPTPRLRVLQALRMLDEDAFLDAA
jgi:hypothetical protein